MTRPIPVLNSNTAVFCALNHTRSSYKPDIYMGSGLSFDASSGVFGGEEVALAVGIGKVKGGSGRVWKERMKRAGPQRERDGGDSFLATTDSIRQQYCTAFCALKHARSSHKPAVHYMDSGLSFGASPGVYRGEDSALAVEVARVGVGAVVFGRNGLRGQDHRESETAGILSLPRPIASISNTAQSSAR